MTYRVKFRALADAEMAEVRAWYDEQQSGLGLEFVQAVAVAIQRIAEAPLSFPRAHGETRRAIVRRFPYAVYFRVEPGNVVVVAVMHTGRDPSRWRNRA